MLLENMKNISAEHLGGISGIWFVIVSNSPVVFSCKFYSKYLKNSKFWNKYFPEIVDIFQILFFSD